MPDIPPPLFVAASKGRLGAVRYLLEAGAPLDGGGEVPGSGWSALTVAARGSAEEIVHVLLMAGADFT